MTPPPPEHPEETPLPPRHRPALGNLAHDTTELDLWALDDDLDLPGDTGEVKPVGVSPASGKEIPTPRERKVAKPRGGDDETSQAAPAEEEQIRMNVNQLGVRKRPSGPLPGPATPEADFDELDHWEDVDLEPVIEELPDEEVLERAVPRGESGMKAGVAVEQVVPPVAEPESDDEFSPVHQKDAAPVSLRPHLSLTKWEKLGLIALLVFLLGGGATFFLMSLHSLPTEAVKAEARDFPITGEKVTILSASSYWRAPNREGPDADTFRRGTVLLPVFELSVDGGPAAIRVLFRSEDKTVIGDAVTRSIKGSEKLIIPATAGFDDLGMHAAYRTGESKPWTIEVYEARTADATGRDFKKLFEMNVSTDRR